jgi:hypothetical protein
MLIISGLIPKTFSKIHINGINVSNISEEEKIEIEEELRNAREDLEDSEIPSMAKNISKKSINYVEKKVFKKTHIKSLVKKIIFGLTSGTILFFDSLNLFNLKFNFWEFILVIIGSYLLATGISSFIPERSEIK